jgi:hypothetical protein
MGILFSVLTAPYAPVRVLTALGRAVQQEVQRERYSPAAVRRRLEAVDAAAVAGELSEAQRAEAQQKVIDSIIVRSDGQDGSAG